MTEPKATYTTGVSTPDNPEPLSRRLEWQLGHPSQRLLAIRLRDARKRYEHVFGHPPQETMNTLDGWALVAWMERAIAEAHIPKGPSTYTPPSPYRVFRIVVNKDF